MILVLFCHLKPNFEWYQNIINIIQEQVTYIVCYVLHEHRCEFVDTFAMLSPCEVSVRCLRPYVDENEEKMVDRSMVARIKSPRFWINLVPSHIPMEETVLMMSNKIVVNQKQRFHDMTFFKEKYDLVGNYKVCTMTKRSIMLMNIDRKKEVRIAPPHVNERFCSADFPQCVFMIPKIQT